MQQSSYSLKFTQKAGENLNVPNTCKVNINSKTYTSLHLL